MNRSTTTTTALLLILGSGLALLPGSVADHDGDLIPDEQEAAVCDQALVGGSVLQPTGVCRDRDNDGTFEDLDVYALRMETVLGPVCDATDNASSEVCILRFFTLGQSICIARAQAPAGDAVLVCSGGQIVLNCSGSVGGEVLAQWISDADCDGHSNDTEVQQGCDPFDAQSYPVGPMECTAGGGGGTPPVGCADASDPVVIVADLLSDADCDGYTNDRELEAGCDPTDATDHPDVEGGCTLLAVPEVPEVPEPPAGAPDDLPVDPSDLPL